MRSQDKIKEKKAEVEEVASETSTTEKINQGLLKATLVGDLPSVERYLNEGADIHTRDKDERTALHLAAENNHLAIAELLIMRKASIEAKMDDDGTPLHDAAANGHTSIIRLLLAYGANVFAVTRDGWTALHWAVDQGKELTTQVLLEYEPSLARQIDSNGCSLLHLLNEGHTLATARLLLLYKADVNTYDGDGNGALHRAVELGDSDLAALLFHKKAEIQYKNKQGLTPLELTTRSEQREAVEKLHQRIIARQMFAHTRFFDAKRSKKDETKGLVKQFHQMRLTPGKKSEKKAIPMTSVPGRRHVMSDAGALSRSVAAGESGWYNSGRAKSGSPSKSWSWEYLHFALGPDVDDLVTSSQYQPQLKPGHAGNFVFKNIGDYGTGDRNILGVIEKVTKSDEQKERQLAKLFLICLKSGSPITTALLRSHIKGFADDSIKKQRSTLLSQLNSVLILTGVKEVVRRMHGSSINLPLAIGYAQGLRLIADGHLRMSDLFDKDAKFGLPTGSKLATTPRGAALATEKLKALNALFLKKYPEAPFTREYFHRQLLDDYGGASDSDGEPYENSDSDEEQERKEKPKLPTLPVLSPPLPLDWPDGILIVDVPDDHNCLFWSAVLGLLLPLLAEKDKAHFNAMFDRLFGTEGFVHITVKKNPTDEKHQRQQIPIQEAREHIRAMLITYDYVRQTPREFEGGCLIDLVCNRFRYRVAQQLSQTFKTQGERDAITQGTGRTWDAYCFDMTRPTAWGGDPEIRAISELAQTNIDVYGHGLPIPYRVTAVDVPLLHLMHTNAEDEKSGAKNHYNFGCVTTALQPLQSKAESSSHQKSAPELPTSLLLAAGKMKHEKPDKKQSNQKAIRANH